MTTFRADSVTLRDAAERLLVISLTSFLQVFEAELSSK